MSASTEREFTAREGFLFLLAYVGIQLASETFNQWGVFFYSPSEDSGRTIYVSIGLAGTMFIIATCWDAITDPLVGWWSDRTGTRPGRLRLIPLRGRRRPFIFWGSIAMTFTFIAMWYPPVPEESIWNFVYGAVMLCLHWTFFTITMVPVLALGPEIARSERARVRLGLWIAGGFILGLLIANGLSGEFLTMIAGVEEGENVPPSAYRTLCTIYALITLAVFQLAAWGLKERYDSETVEHRAAPVFQGFADAARNAPFVIFFVTFFFFTTGFLAVQRVLPYWAVLGLEGNEGTVTELLLPYIVGAVAALGFSSALARRLGTKWMMFLSLFILTAGLPWMYVIAVAELPAAMKVQLGGALFFCSGIGQGILYVMITPMLGEIIDYDARRSGERREALYNGLWGVAWKASMAGSILLATQSMDIFGNSSEEPWGVYLVGPFAGFFGLLGLAALWFYPKMEHAEAVDISRSTH